MVYFVTGRAGSGKSHYIHSVVRQKVLDGSDKLMLIVPEQSSFAMERSLLNQLGPLNASKVEVMNFTRLLGLVERQTGKRHGTRLCDGGRSVLMSMAIESVANRLSVYKDQAHRPAFAQLMVMMQRELKVCGVSYRSLLATTDTVESNLLKAKITETSLILNAFETIISSAYVDPLDDLARLCAHLENHEFFSGYDVFVDEFDAFTGQQLKVLDHILRQSCNCYMSLCTDSEDFCDSEFELFSVINRTARNIIKIVKRRGLSFRRLDECCSNSRRFVSQELRLLEAEVFSNDRITSPPKKNTDIVIYNAQDVYDEADFIARSIKRLVLENGFLYRDFAIISRTDEYYSGILELCFQKYGIPYFGDTRENISSKPLMRFVLSSLDIVTRGFLSDDILRYLKTMLSGVAPDDIALLENYVFLWDIDGKQWLSPFTKSVYGFNGDREDSLTLLNELDTLRTRIIDPLSVFMESIKAASGKEISKAIYDLLVAVDVSANLSDITNQLHSRGEISLAKDQARLWEVLMSMLDQMAAILGETAVTPSRYAELFRLMVLENEIAYIPRVIDQVTISTAERIRPEGIRAVFILGAAQGNFPRYPVSAGVFSDTERRLLISMGANLYDSNEKLAVTEQFLAYRAMTAASEKLYISWADTDRSGSRGMPSEIIREIVKVFPHIAIRDKHSTDMSDEIFALLPALELCAEHWNDGSRFSTTLKAYFADKPEYAPILLALSRVSKGSSMSLECRSTRDALFSNGMHFSASSVESYHLCKFQYFCKYILCIRERKKAEFDLLTYGNIMHWLLEGVFKSHPPTKLQSMEPEALTHSLALLLDNYVTEKMGGIHDKPERLKFLLSRIVDTAQPIVSHMALELSQSHFVPIGVELQIGQNGLAPLHLKLRDGTLVTVSGKADRVDIMREESVNFARVVDYKTGARKFNLSDILYGLNLQMLIYLCALCGNNSSGPQSRFIPSGVLYMPAISTVISEDRDTPAEKVLAKQLKKLQMNGLILDDTRVIYGMDRDAKGKFIDVKLSESGKLSGGTAVDISSMRFISQHVSDCVLSMGESLKQGDISAVPACGRYEPCEFCSYKPACAFESGMRGRVIQKSSDSAVVDELKKRYRTEESL